MFALWQFWVDKAEAGNTVKTAHLILSKLKIQAVFTRKTDASKLA